MRFRIEGPTSLWKLDATGCPELGCWIEIRRPDAGDVVYAETFEFKEFRSWRFAHPFSVASGEVLEIETAIPVNLIANDSRFPLGALHD